MGENQKLDGVNESGDGGKNRSKTLNKPVVLQHHFCCKLFVVRVFILVSKEKDIKVNRIQ